MEFNSGFISIIGRPNVGKSTLINALTGQKISIISPKPQTTRNTIKAVLTNDESQIIFIDTPGIHTPKNKLGKIMVKSILETLEDIDAVILIIEATDTSENIQNISTINKLKDLKTPVFLIINKIDSINKDKVLKVINEYKNLMDFESIIPISALKFDGIDIVLKSVKKVLKVGPKYFPDDMITDQPERLIVSEIIREKMLYHLEDEVPHGIGVEIFSFKERENDGLIEINAVIYCEKKSHKAIIIGKKGEMLKKIGSKARKDIERLLGCRIYLELWVKVKNDWRNNDLALRTLGYRD